MTLPNHELTWQFNLNNYSPGVNASSDNNWLLWRMKNIMTGFAVNPWMVIRSSDGVTASDSDLWADHTTNIIYGQTTSTARSWIVLQQSTLDNFQILIDCRYVFGQGGGTENIHVSISKTGSFTGGSETTVPTAPDGLLILANNLWGGTNTAAGLNRHVLHGMMSEDGYCTRLFVFNEDQGTDPQAFWQIEKCKNHLDGASPVITIDGQFSNSGTTNGLYLLNLTGGGVSDNNLKVIYDGISISSSYTTEGAAGNMLPLALVRPNEISGKYEFFPNNIYASHSKYRDLIGQLHDSYMTTFNLDQTYWPDADGNPMKWVVVKNLVFPWDGSTVMDYTP